VPRRRSEGQIAGSEGRVHLVVLAVAAVFALGGCSDDVRSGRAGPSTPASADTADTAGTVAPAASASGPFELRPVLQVVGGVAAGQRPALERRLAELRISLGIPDDLTAAQVAADMEAGRGASGVDVTDPGFLEAHQLETQLAATTTPPAERTPEAEVQLADADGSLYLLGPTVAGRSVVEAAKAVPGAGGDGWVVSLLLRPGAAGVDEFNRIAAMCFRGEPRCPASVGGRGQLAFVLGDTVLSAPSVNDDAFERDAVQIYGAFTRGEAERIAAELSGR
jgi:hypothetical protein